MDIEGHYHKGTKDMTDRFKVLSSRETIHTGKTGVDENGNEISLTTQHRREIRLQDTKKVYGDNDGIVAEFYDMEFAVKLCKILNQCWIK